MGGDTSERGPGTLVARHYTAVTTTAALALASVALVAGHPLLAVPPAVGLAVALALSGPIRRRLDPTADRPADPETVRALEDLRRGYADGRIDEREYERRYDAIVEGRQDEETRGRERRSSASDRSDR